MESTNSDWRVLEFFTPIKESLEEDNVFLIRGVAINETTTLNNVKYVAEELSAAAPTFRNVPILLDHKNEVSNIVGRTTENVNFNPQLKRIEFEAKIMDEKIKEMIKDGRIGSVSIGAKVNDLLEEEDGSMKAIGLQGLEISLVAVPGDNQATLAQALQQSFHLKEMAMKNVSNDADKKVNNYGGKTMTEATEEQEKPVEAPAEEEAKEETEAPKEEAAEEPAAESTEEVKTEMAGLKTQISELKDLFLMKKKIQEDAEEAKEEPAKEEPVEAKEEPVDETKGEVATENEESTEEKLKKINGLIVEKSRQGYAMYTDYSKVGEDTKLNRLVR